MRSEGESWHRDEVAEELGRPGMIGMLPNPPLQRPSRSADK